MAEEKALIKLRLPKLLMMVQEQERYDKIRAGLLKKIRRNHDIEVGLIDEISGCGFEDDE